MSYPRIRLYKIITNLKTPPAMAIDEARGRARVGGELAGTLSLIVYSCADTAQHERQALKINRLFLHLFP